MKQRTAQPTAALVAALADPEARGHAAAEIVRRHRPRVERELRRGLGRRDVQDLVQEVFLRLFVRVHTLEEPRALASFIGAITTRVLRWELRRTRVHARILLTDAPDELADPRASDADARQLHRLIAQLPDGERQAFLLRHVQEMTLPQVAKILGVSLSTTKRLLGRARRRLERTLDPRDGFG